eukprot:jgi/Chrzof1/6067/Cz17g07150.t1
MRTTIVFLVLSLAAVASARELKQMDMAFPPLSAFLPPAADFKDLPSFNEFLKKVNLPALDTLDIGNISDYLRLPANPPAVELPPLPQLVQLLGIQMPNLNIPLPNGQSIALPPLDPKMLPNISFTLPSINYTALPALPKTLPDINSILAALPPLDSITLPDLNKPLTNQLPDFSKFNFSALAPVAAQLPPLESLLGAIYLPGPPNADGSAGAPITLQSLAPMVEGFLKKLPDLASLINTVGPVVQKYAGRKML